MDISRNAKKNTSRQDLRAPAKLRHHLVRLQRSSEPSLMKCSSLIQRKLPMRTKSCDMRKALQNQ